MTCSNSCQVKKSRRSIIWFLEQEGDGELVKAVIKEASPEEIVADIKKLGELFTTAQFQKAVSLL